MEFQYQKAEYEEARRKFLWMKRLITKTQIVVTAAALALSVTMTATKGATGMWTVLGAVGVLLAGMMLYAYYIQPGQIFDSTEKFQQAYRLEFTEDGIQFQTESVSSRLNWDMYTALWETKDFFYLMQSRDAYTLLPKRVFASDAQADSFRELCRQSIPGGEYRQFK